MTGRRRNLTILGRVFVEERAEGWGTISAVRLVWACLITAQSGGVGADTIAAVRHLVLALDRVMALDPANEEVRRARRLTGPLVDVLDALVDTPALAWDRYRALEMLAGADLLGTDSDTSL